MKVGSAEKPKKRGQSSKHNQGMEGDIMTSVSPNRVNQCLLARVRSCEQSTDYPRGLAPWGGKTAPPLPVNQQWHSRLQPGAKSSYLSRHPGRHRDCPQSHVPIWTSGHTDQAQLGTTLCHKVLAHPRDTAAPLGAHVPSTRLITGAV